MPSQLERKERRRKIAEFIKSGGNVYEAVGKFYVSEATVLNACEEFRVKPRRPNKASKKKKSAKKLYKPKMTPEKREQRRQKMADAVADGRRVASVAKRFGVSESTVRAACKQYGVSPPERKVRENLTQDELLQAVALLMQGKKQQEVANRLNTSHQAIGHIYRRAKEWRVLGPRAIWKQNRRKGTSR